VSKTSAPRPEDDPSVRDVVTHLLRREVKSLTYWDPLVRNDLDPEGVHQLRVSARRLRSELEALEAVASRGPWRSLRDDLKWMGRVLGALRDLDVLAALFDERLVHSSALRGEVLSTIARQTTKRRRDVTALLESSRYARLVRQLTEWSETPEGGVLWSQSAREVLLPVLWNAACAYVDAVGSPYERRSDAALHRVRIASKRCRYHFEVATFYLGEEAREVATTLALIQDVLGQVHDRAVAVSFLDTLAHASEDDIEVRRALRTEIGELRPQWIGHFEVARRGILGVFDPA